MVGEGEHQKYSIIGTSDSAASKPASAGVVP